MFALLCAMAMCRFASAGHGLDNNWTVKVTGLRDAAGCVRVTELEDLGANLPTTSQMTCLSATNMCSDNYDCQAARASKPSNFQGCTFDATTAVDATVTGVLMDGLCYRNFVVEQKNFNGQPGWAPDKVHVRSEAHLHTRACLVVNYCAKTGFYLLRPTTGDYAYEAQMEEGTSAEKVFDFLIEARHSSCTTTTTTEKANMDSAQKMQAIGASMLLAFFLSFK
ncbi:unnamed protein product [Durusdinium trenchii]|uniref:Uncharacterized protein n=2 Tax=Durusdinium trenchii TaxID=1381693 RepID=A0ABP0KLC2_9DINO